MLEPGVCEVWWASPASAQSGLLALLDDAERVRHVRLRLDADRSRFLAAHALARLVLADQLGVDPVAVRFGPTRCSCGQWHGKPRLFGESGGLELSLSHSGQRVVVAVTTAGPVGVDVEQLREMSDVEEFAAAVLVERERRALSQFPAASRSWALLTYWTRKEALLKASGDGLRRPATDVVVSAPGEPAELLEWSGAPGRRAQVFSLAPGTGHLASLAVLTGRPIRVQERNADQLLWRSPRSPLRSGGRRRSGSC